MRRGNQPPPPAPPDDQGQGSRPDEGQADAPAGTSAKRKSTILDLILPGYEVDPTTPDPEKGGGVPRRAPDPPPRRRTQNNSSVIPLLLGVALVVMVIGARR